ncbi:MAG: pilin [Candidatus Paceibacterota bacterium]|jgi:hypothetical protein
MRKILLNLFLGFIILLPVLSHSALINSGDPETYNLDSIKGIIKEGVKWFFGIAASIAAIGFAVAGIKILINPGSSSEREAAKEVFKKTAIGLLIAVVGPAIVVAIIREFVSDGTNPLRFFNF